MSTTNAHLNVYEIDLLRPPFLWGNDPDTATVSPKAWHNGRMVDVRGAAIHVMSPSVQYAMGTVFEGERWNENGIVFEGDEHTRRLIASMRGIGATLPEDLTVERLDELKRAVVEANGLQKGAYIRVSVSATPTASGIAGDPKMPGVVTIHTWDWRGYHSDADKGLNLRIGDLRLPDPSTVPDIESKAGHLYGARAFEKATAMRMGFSDALMLHMPTPDGKNLVAEGTGMNVAFIKGGKIITPITKGRMLTSITARTLFHVVAPALSMEVEQRDIDVTEIAEMEEMVCMGTAAGVVRVAKVEGFEFPKRDAATKLMEAYEEVYRGRKTVATSLPALPPRVIKRAVSNVPDNLRAPFTEAHAEGGAGAGRLVVAAPAIPSGIHEQVQAGPR